MRFRVYDKVENKFYYPGPAGERFKIDSAGNLINPNGYPGDKTQIAQFSSGVFDKNGVEIYDGDVVEYRLWDKKVTDLVSYDKENLMWVMTNLKDKQTVCQFVKYLDYIVSRE